jgi:hypothetical protein
MPTDTEVRLPTLTELKAVENALGTVYSEIERLAALVQEVARCWEEEGHVGAVLPTYAEIGQLFLFADALRIDAKQIVARADEITSLQANLGSIAAMMTRPMSD